MKSKSNWNLLLGAAFLMATSAMGPGFLTQTTVFTEKLAASFGFVILMTIVFHIGAQLNIWRVIAAAERRAQDIANMLLPGLGFALAGLVVLGGFIFNIGNMGGTGLGLNALTGMHPVTGALISALVAITVFLNRDAEKVMDWFVKILGLCMIMLCVYVAFASRPPLAEAALRTLIPEKIDPLIIITLTGGTIGGYISFAGGHRLLDAGIKGQGLMNQVNRSAMSGVLITGVMRAVLFLAVLGVVSRGLIIDSANPPASVFRLSAGVAGYRFFGIVMWAASITSVIGASYTSVSFIRSFSPAIERNHRTWIMIFIMLSTIVFVLVERPVEVLIFAGTANGFILPAALTVILIAAFKKRIVGNYKHPVWMAALGGAVAAVMAAMSAYSLIKLFC